MKIDRANKKLKIGVNVQINKQFHFQYLLLYSKWKDCPRSVQKKPTDRNMCLLPTSCHPPFQQENIPFSLAMIINKICIFPETRDQKLAEIKYWLIKRDYQTGLVNGTINKVRNIPRDNALK